MSEVAKMFGTVINMVKVGKSWTKEKGRTRCEEHLMLKRH